MSTRNPADSAAAEGHSRTRFLASGDKGGRGRSCRGDVGVEPGSRHQSTAGSALPDRGAARGATRAPARTTLAGARRIDAVRESPGGAIPGPPTAEKTERCVRAMATGPSPVRIRDGKMWGSSRRPLRYGTGEGAGLDSTPAMGGGCAAGSGSDGRRRSRRQARPAPLCRDGKGPQPENGNFRAPGWPRAGYRGRAILLSV